MSTPLTLAMLKSSLVWSGISQVSLDPFSLSLCPAIHGTLFLMEKEFLHHFTAMNWPSPSKPHWGALIS